jgi:hypothetical protein
MAARRAGVGALLLCLLLPGAASGAPELPIIAQLKSQVKSLSGDLAVQRKQLASASTTAVRAEADAARLTQQRAQVRRIAQHMPVLRRQLLATVDDSSYAAQVVKDAAASRTSADARLATVTESAAAVQANLSDTQRRLAALQRAIDSQNAPPDQRDAAIVSHRWGGPDTAPVSAATLDQYLESKASPIAGNGAALMRAGLRYNVDPRLVVAIAGAESYFGVQTCAAHNAWGWGCPSNPFVFRSWAEGIDTIARGLRENYLDGGRTSVDAIHAKYAPVGVSNDPDNLNYAWSNNVSHFLQEQGGNPSKVDGDGPVAAE